MKSWASHTCPVLVQPVRLLLQQLHVPRTARNFLQSQSLVGEFHQVVIIHPQVPREKCSLSGRCSSSCIQQSSWGCLPHPRVPPKGVLPPFIIPITLSPFPSPRIHGLSLNITIAAGEQVNRETAPDEIIPFSSSDVALKQNSDCWADYRFDQLRVKTWTSCSIVWLKGAGMTTLMYISLV